ncbi:MAG: GldG family protein [Bacteroidetes bacterium]|nr:GldG family protein [Bacteroidota bacterium]MCH8524364.1 GldG family protein [Balneolales bacterium]
MKKQHIYLTTALAVAVVVLINLIGSASGVRMDTTREGLYSLTQISRDILERLEEPVEITHFYIAADPRFRPTLELLREYERRSPLITARAYDINTHPSVARSMGVTFQGTTIIRMGDRVQEVSGGDEVSVTNGIYRMLNTQGRTIYFTAGHGEYDLFSMVSEDHLEGEGDEDRPIFLHESRGLAKLRERLELMGHTAEQIFPQTGQPVPADADLVVIVSPSETFPSESLQAIRDYLDDGGRLFVMLDAFRDGGLGEILSEFGIVPQNDLVVDFGNHFWNDATAPATGRYTRHAITERLPLTFFPGVQSLQVAENLPDHINVTTLFSSSSRSISVSDMEQLNRLRNLDLPVQSYDLMMISEVGRGDDRTKIAVIGDGDVAANEYLSILGNERLVVNTINWLMGADERLDLPAATYELPMVNLTNRQMQFTFIISTVMMPLLFILAGVGVWWVRRKQ